MAKAKYDDIKDLKTRVDFIEDVLQDKNTILESRLNMIDEKVKMMNEMISLLRQNIDMMKNMHEGGQQFAPSFTYHESPTKLAYSHQSQPLASQQAPAPNLISSDDITKRTRSVI